MIQRQPSSNYRDDAGTIPTERHTSLGTVFLVCCLNLTLRIYNHSYTSDRMRDLLLIACLM